MDTFKKYLPLAPNPLWPALIPPILYAPCVMYMICIGLYKCVISELVFMAEWWASTDLIIYIDKEDLERYYGKEHGFLIMNHRYEVDWLMGWVLCDRVKILGVSW
jgi:lysophosphatidic acid acyltransferase/lysophosphatidylinositol acyltransferase